MPSILTQGVIVQGKLPPPDGSHLECDIWQRLLCFLPPPATLCLHSHYSADPDPLPKKNLWASKEERAVNMGGLDHTDQFQKLHCWKTVTKVVPIDLLIPFQCCCLQWIYSGMQTPKKSSVKTTGNCFSIGAGKVLDKQLPANQVPAQEPKQDHHYGLEH